jgi:hypothetical protein
MSEADDILLQQKQQRLAADKERLRKVILKLRTQVRNPSILDAFLSNLNPVTAIDGRLPFTPKKVVTTANKTLCLHNAIAHAVLSWGKLARGEAEEPNPDLVLVEKIAETGFAKWGAYPKDRNSAIHVLRTATEEKQIRADRANATARALEMKANTRDVLIEVPAVKPTGLEQEEPNESDAEEGVVEGGVGGVGEAPGVEAPGGES